MCPQGVGAVLKSFRKEAEKAPKVIPRRLITQALTLSPSIGLRDLLNCVDQKALSASVNALATGPLLLSDALPRGGFAGELCRAGAVAYIPGGGLLLFQMSRAMRHESVSFLS
jgi:hypothetical protein